MRFQFFAQRTEQGTDVGLWFSSKRDPQDPFAGLRWLLALVGLISTLFFAVVFPPHAEADFGVKELNVTAVNADKTTDLQAGSHPFEFELAFAMNQDEGFPEGRLRDLIVDLPAGMAGNPFALPPCTTADFEGPTPHCPGNTQVGVANVDAAEGLSGRAHRFPKIVGGGRRAASSG